MSTATFDVAMSISTRLGELKRLVAHAIYSREKLNDEHIYNSLCRACCILLASNLEGFLKELSRSLVLDLNYYLQDFSKMPAMMQRTFCEKIVYFEGVPEADHQKRTTQLISFFTKNSVQIDLQAITYNQNPNKNPSPNFIDSAFEKIGIYSILNTLTESRLEDVFKNNRALNYKLLRDMSRCKSHLYSFPYRNTSPDYSFKQFTKADKKQTPNNTIWHDYIEEILTRRHSIAHGDTLQNDTTAEQLESDITKLEVLMYGLMYSATSQVSNQT